MTRPRHRRVSLPGWIAIVLVAAVLLAGAVVVWNYLGTSLGAQDTYRRQAGELKQSWNSAGDNDHGEGEPFALLRVPRFGDSYEVPILDGVGTKELSHGVGWYPYTAKPGELGNFVVAGYRVSHGEPFAHLLELAVDDLIEIETRQAIYIYAVVSAPADLTVQANDEWVLDAVPGRPGTVPREALITLTTSQDKLPTGDRSVGIGRLVETRQK